MFCVHFSILYHSTFIFEFDTFSLIVDVDKNKQAYLHTVVYFVFFMTQYAPLGIYRHSTIVVKPFFCWLDRFALHVSSYKLKWTPGSEVIICFVQTLCFIQ